MPCRICRAHIRRRRLVLAHAGSQAPTWQHELAHTTRSGTDLSASRDLDEAGTDHTDHTDRLSEVWGFTLPDSVRLPTFLLLPSPFVVVWNHRPGVFQKPDASLEVKEMSGSLPEVSGGVSVPSVGGGADVDVVFCVDVCLA